MGLVKDYETIAPVYAGVIQGFTNKRPPVLHGRLFEKLIQRVGAPVNFDTKLALK